MKIDTQRSASMVCENETKACVEEVYKSLHSTRGTAENMYTVQVVKKHMPY